MKENVMRVFSLLLMLLSAGALAQASGGSRDNRTSRGNLLRIPNYETPGTAAQTYFVDGTNGNDSNACASSGTGACATIQAALNKVPKLLRDQVTVSIAAGNYTGALITGFTVDNGLQQTTGGLLIDGALVTSTLATGSATGTAAGAGQSAGSGSTFGTLCDSGETWTVGDLVGRFITTASPTNATRVVTANTATCVTVAGTWNLPVAASTTYTIQDPSVILTTGTTAPATPVNAASANRAGFFIAGNGFTYSQNALVIRNIRVATAAGQGIIFADVGGVRLEEDQIRPASTTSPPIQLGGTSASSFLGAYSPASSLTMVNVDLSINANLIGINMTQGLLAASQSLFRNANTSNTAIVCSTSSGADCHLALWTQNRIAGWANGIQWAGMASAGIGTGQMQANQISCGSAGAAIIVESPSQLLSVAGPATIFGPITTLNVDTCGTAVQIIGTGAADVTSLTGSVATTGFDVRLGGLVTFAKAGVTITAGTNEINLDSGALTASFADVTAGSCVSTIGQSSRVCGR